MRIVRPAGTLVKGGVLDNGPFTCGRWTTVKLVPGTRISKRFAVENEKGKVRWQLFTSGGLLVYKVNGKEYSAFLKPGNDFAEFEVSPAFEIEIVTVPEGEMECMAVFDRRRNYKRSAFNGEPVEGEWVMRFSF